MAPQLIALADFPKKQGSMHNTQLTTVYRPTFQVPFSVIFIEENLRKNKMITRECS